MPQEPNHFLRKKTKHPYIFNNNGSQVLKKRSKQEKVERPTQGKFLLKKAVLFLFLFFPFHFLHCFRIFVYLFICEYFSSLYFIYLSILCRSIYSYPAHPHTFLEILGEVVVGCCLWLYCVKVFVVLTQESIMSSWHHQHALFCVEVFINKTNIYAHKVNSERKKRKEKRNTINVFHGTFFSLKHLSVNVFVVLTHENIMSSWHH